ncbi:MAG: phospholipid carrier-dependent glycosyltransferase [Actinomycetota bacterium]
MGLIGGDSVRSGFARLPESLSQRLPELGIGLGLISGLASIVVYDRSGYGRGMLVLWLASLVVLAISFGSRARSWPRIERIDVVLPGLLAAVLSPLYLAALYRWPVQVSSDETAVMFVSRHYASAPDVDPFGVSTYLNRPTLLFIGWGKLGNLLGGIDLYHMRLLHAFVGLLVLVASYALFRQLLPSRWALFATFIVGVSHSFFMISRLAMREDTAVLVEVVAFALLLWGLRNDHELATFLGGVAAGLGFYVYFPARIAFPLWLFALVCLALLYRRSFPLRKLLMFGSVALAGVVLIAAPIVIAESKIPVGSTQPNKETLLVFSQAREVQRAWVFAPTQWEGYKQNVEWGLTTFNNEIVDHGWIYINTGHGFVDPLTGILLWLGVGLVAVRLWRRREDEGSFLMLACFLALWLSFAFFVNKSPNYTRLLITLPFVAYLVTEAVRWLAHRWRSVRYVPAALVGTVVAALVIWNLAIAWDFIQEGREFGDPIGSTGRYVQSRRDIPGQQFYVASPAQTAGALSYFSFGSAADRLRQFSRDENQVGADVDPSQLSFFNATPPFSLFMTRSVWGSSGIALEEKYPQGRLRNVIPDGTHVVFEVSPES